jgi:hypothetical protein
MIWFDRRPDRDERTFRLLRSHLRLREPNQGIMNLSNEHWHVTERDVVIRDLGCNNVSRQVDKDFIFQGSILLKGAAMVA